MKNIIDKIDNILFEAERPNEETLDWWNSHNLESQKEWVKKHPDGDIAKLVKSNVLKYGKKYGNNDKPVNAGINVKPVNVKSNKSYIGNCTQDDFVEDFFSDATKMAQEVEDGTKISKEEFMKNVNIRPEHLKGKKEYYKKGNLYWVYDVSRDVHHFYN